MKLTAAATNPFNAINRGVYIADNLDFLRAINSASVDLVCIDPPFAKNDTFTADRLKPPLTAAEKDNEMRLLQQLGIATQEQADSAGIAWPDDPKARGGYRDTWSWDEDIHEDWVDGIKATHPAVNMLLEAAREIHGDSIAAYLAFMAIRLFEIHRILKPTGSLYLHCDHTVNGYLRQLLDGVFGPDNLMCEVIWGYGTPSGGRAAGKKPVKAHDTIFSYAKNYGQHLYNRINLPYNPEYVERWFRHTDENGRRYQTRSRRGQIVRQYLDESPGIPLSDTWTDIKQLYGSAGWFPGRQVEITGYPTQKPAILAERIIRASTNPGDVVLDCFAGCAYVAVAAEMMRQADPKQERIWAACDINPRAWTVFKRQFNKPELVLLNCNDQTTGQQVMGNEPTVTVHGPAELPKRTVGGSVEVKPLRTDNRRQRERRYKRASTLFDRDEMLAKLLYFSSGRAWCCGFISQNADGSYALGDYELDHVAPKSGEYWEGQDEIENRAPLCSTHNQLKSNRSITLEELRYEVIDRGELKVPVRALPNLQAAYLYAVRVKSEAYQLSQSKTLGI